MFGRTQLGAADLRQGKAAKLSAVLDSAASSLVLPFASSQVSEPRSYMVHGTASNSAHSYVQTEQGIARNVQTSLEQAGVVVKVRNTPWAMPAWGGV